MSKNLAPSTTSFFPRTFINNQFCSKPQHPPKNTDLSNKVAIVTGANTGLGYESARQLLSLNLSHLIIAVRSAEKGEAAASKLRSLYPNARLEVLLLDMSSYSSIKAFVERIKSHLSRLDIVILNAGLTKTKFDLISTTGHEETIQVNYLSTALLAILLLPVLKGKSSPGTPGRLAIVNSADYVSADDVVVNHVDPGFVKGTEFSRDAPGVVKAGLKVLSEVTARTVEEGASTYIDAVAVKGKESHGCFLMSWEVKPYAACLYSPDGKQVIEQLWEETMEEFEFANARGLLESMH